MIIWLASYPKSGNTWVRSFLYSLLYSSDQKPDLNKMNIIGQYPVRKHFEKYTNNFNNFKEISKLWKISQSDLNVDKKIKFLKTHHVNCTIEGNKFIHSNDTFGVIHIIRDPRNVITSIMNQYSKKDYNEAFDFISDTLHCIDVENSSHQNIDKKLILNTLISSWNNHYNSWKNVSRNYLLIKYEDLESNPIETFTKLANYINNVLKIDIDKEKINKIINLNKFDNLKNMEKKHGFNEAPIDDKNKKKIFFNLGPSNKWENLLPKDIKFKIENLFKKEMEELKYLP